MPKFDKVLLASDFDNTLVYTEGALARGEDVPPMSERNREAIEYFIQNGGYFSISTGRALPAFVRYAKDLPCNAPCVIANGAGIYDFSKNCYVETAFLDVDIYDHVDALLARFPGLCFVVYHDDRRIHVLHPNEFTRNHEHLTRAKTVEVKDFREVDLPVIKLLFEEEKPLLLGVRDFITSQEWGKRYELIFSSDHLLELTRRGATKGGMITEARKASRRRAQGHLLHRRPQQRHPDARGLGDRLRARKCHPRGQGLGRAHRLPLQGRRAGGCGGDTRQAILTSKRWQSHLFEGDAARGSARAKGAHVCGLRGVFSGAHGNRRSAASGG